MIIKKNTTIILICHSTLGTGEKAALFGNLRYWESYNITYKTLIWDLEMGDGTGRRRYWEGRYWGGGGGGATVLCNPQRNP